MSCILRISGDTLDIDALLSKHELLPDSVWKKGQPRSVGESRHSTSGAHFVASDADLDEFARQVTDATAFLEKHALTIQAIARYSGVQDIVLDFGVSLNEGYVAQFCYLPPQLVQLAASAGIALEISHYACSGD